jgi:hypothetical protein
MKCEDKYIRIGQETDNVGSKMDNRYTLRA